jgi:hypothetical protein
MYAWCSGPDTGNTDRYMRSVEARRDHKFSSKSGWWMKVYRGPANMDKIPAPETMTLIGKKIVQEIDFQNTENFRAKVPGTPDENYVWVFAGTLGIEKPGDYEICTKSDDGSKLYLKGEVLVDNDGLHGPEQKCKTTKLEAGRHRVSTIGFQHGGGAFMQVTYKGPDTDGVSKLMRSTTRRHSTLLSSGRGWVMKIMRGPGGMTQIPNFMGLRNLGTAIVNKIDFRSDGQFRREVYRTPGSNYVWAFGGTLRIKQAGEILPWLHAYVCMAYVCVCVCVCL